MSDFCPEHECPMVKAGSETVCLWERANSVVGREIVDLIVDDGETVLLFDGGGILPMHGWSGNARAAEDDESADGLLDVLEENYLLAAEPDERSITLHIADHPGGLEDSQWMLELTW